MGREHQPRAALAEPRQAEVALFGTFPGPGGSAHARARTTLSQRCATAAGLNLTSELGIAPCFNIHVQTGGVKPESREALAPRTPGEPEQPHRETLADFVADTALERFRNDVRCRRLTIARGEEAVRGVHVDLAV